jgi:hypothetical protein
MRESLRDSLWLWGTKVNVLSEHYRLPPSTMTIRAGLDALGIDRAMMCGHLPPTKGEYLHVAHCRSLLWEMSFDEGFSFERPLAPIVRLHRRHRNVLGVLLDDFSTTEINRGAKPELLGRLRAAMPDPMQLWIVVYSMSLGIPDLDRYLEYVDGVSFWIWEPENLPNMTSYVARCHELSGHKPMVVGLYFYDFSKDRPLTNDRMAAQTETAANLVATGECQGICFLSSSVMDVGLESVEWTKRWIRRLGT